MRPLHCLAVTLAVIILFAGPASAAVVTFDLVPANTPNATEVTALPGSEVPYQIFVEVTSEDPNLVDNNGLSFFSINIGTNLVVEQPPLTQFSPQIAQTFTIVQSLGTPSGDDILQIGGGQNTFAGGSVTGGIGQAQAVLIGQGVFRTPTLEGPYQVAIDATTSTANVFTAGSLNSAVAATLVAGPGFTINVVESTDGGGDGNGGGDGDGGGDGETPPTTQPVQPASPEALGMGIVFGLTTLVVVLAAFFLAGPLAAMIAIVLIPLLFLLGLLNT